MNKNIFIILVFTLIGCTQPVPPNDDISIYDMGYSPLYKYHDFSMKKVADVDFNPSDLLGAYNGVKSDFLVRQGIISNSNYVHLLGNNVVHYSNGNNATLYTFSSMSDIDYLDANLKYIAFLSNSNFMVIDTNGSNCLSITIDPSNFIATFGKSDSDLLVYGIKQLNYGYGGEILLYKGRHQLTITNIKTHTFITNFDTYGVIDFSRNNRYLFFTSYTTGTYNDNLIALSKFGPLSIYDMQNSNIVHIGDLAYDIEKYGPNTWSDAIVGITEDLTKFYVYQTRTDSYAIGGPLADGRYPSEVQGVWEIDISSLGLSE